MHLLDKLGYVALDVVDLDAAVDFYENVIQLDVSERRADVAFLRGAVEHHWFRLHASTTPAVRRVGYRAASEAAFEEIAARLDTQGVPWTSGGGFDEDRVERFIRFTDPDGFPIEVFNEMIEFPTPRWRRFVDFENLCHAVVNVSDLRESVHFYEAVLGFRVSDWVERAGAFMRCGDGYHHSLALLGRPEFAGTLDHICMNLRSIDDVMRGRANAVSRGVALRSDILRHSASGSMGFYMFEPFVGIALEFCTGHVRIDDDDHHRPRVLPMAPSTYDVWTAAPLGATTPRPGVEAVTGGMAVAPGVGNDAGAESEAVGV